MLVLLEPPLLPEKDEPPDEPLPPKLEPPVLPVPEPVEPGPTPKPLPVMQSEGLADRQAMQPALFVTSVAEGDNVSIN
jgi:hypothetical protein